MRANIIKNDRRGIEIDNVNCNICNMQLKVPELDEHLASTFHLRNKDHLDAKFNRFMNTTQPKQQSVLDKWLQSML